MILTPTDPNIWRTTAQAIVIPVNTVGILGAGLAKQAAKVNYNLAVHYQRLCLQGKLRTHHHDPNPCVLWTDSGKDDPATPCPLILFPTKRHWRDTPTLPLLKQSLDGLVLLLAEHPEVTSIAMPAIGCGCGGLAWDTVRPDIERVFGEHPVNVYLHSPHEGV